MGGKEGKMAGVTDWAAQPPRGSPTGSGRGGSFPAAPLGQEKRLPGHLGRVTPLGVSLYKFA